MRGIPEAEVGALAGGDGAPVGQAKGAGGVDGGALKCLKRGHAEEGAGHVHRQRQRCHGGRAGVAIGGDGHGHACRTQGGDGWDLGFAQGVECAGQDHGGGACGGHGLNTRIRQIFQMIGRQGVVAGGEGRAAEIGQLFGVEFDREAKLPCGGKQAVHLSRGEGDAFAKGIDGVDQPFGMGGVQGGDCHIVKIGIGATCVFGRDGVGGEVGCGDVDGAQRADAAGGAEHVQFGCNIEAVAGFDLKRGGAGGEHLVKAGQGLRHQIIHGCRTGGADGGQDAAACAGDLFVAGPIQAHFEFGGTVACKDDMAVTINQAGGQQGAVAIVAVIVPKGRRHIRNRAHPLHQSGIHRHGGIADQAVAIGHRGGCCVDEHRSHGTCFRAGCGIIMSIHIALSREALMHIHAKTALLPDGWADDVRVSVVAGRIAQVEVGTPGGAGILCPAPVNLHSHTFQRAMAGLTEHRTAGQDSFWTWRALMYRFLERLTPDDVEAIAAQVFVEMAEAGYAGVCEFHYLHHGPDGVPYDNPAELALRIAAAADAVGLGLTLLPVLYERGGCDGRALAGGQLRFGNDLDGFARLWGAAQDGLRDAPADAVIGVAPHSLRAVSPYGLGVVAGMAPLAPLHLHLAEQVAEVDEVLAHTGARPVEWLLAHADVDARWCLIHATQMQPHETQALALTGAVAGLCPITEANLGDGIFDGMGWQAAGGAYGVGSDSNVRVSLTEELRLLEYSQRLAHRGRAMLAGDGQSTGRRLFDAACAGGAQAAGRQAGAIRVGDWADLLRLDASGDLGTRRGDAILDTLIFAGDDRMVTDVWSAGRHIVTQGRHPQREAIGTRFRAVMARLGDAI